MKILWFHPKRVYRVTRTITMQEIGVNKLLPDSFFATRGDLICFEDPRPSLFFFLPKKVFRCCNVIYLDRGSRVIPHKCAFLEEVNEFKIVEDQGFLYDLNFNFLNY